MKCLDDHDAKKKLWSNISLAMHEMGYFVSDRNEVTLTKKKSLKCIVNTQRSSNDCCNKWKDLCRSIQFGGVYNEYASERVKCLLDEVVNNYSPTSVIEVKIVPSFNSLLQTDEYFEIMV